MRLDIGLITCFDDPAQAPEDHPCNGTSGLAQFLREVSPNGSR